ncbi:hypothetical protein Lser_V15G02520 [Lactuca serriola]
MGIQGSELNCSSEQLPNCYFNPNCDNSMEQRDIFESALSSIVSSPTNSHPGIPIPSSGNGGESIVIRELIGRLGSICSSGEISPQSRINGNNNTNNSSYNSPLNSPQLVRREKISERMKFLQDLVPGCNKVTGNQVKKEGLLCIWEWSKGRLEFADYLELETLKAELEAEVQLSVMMQVQEVMLDEIINYVQSLQRQVEFLSMKLATVSKEYVRVVKARDLPAFVTLMLKFVLETARVKLIILKRNLTLNGTKCLPSPERGFKPLCLKSL